MTELARLVEAAKRGDTASVKSLLDKNSQLACERDETGATALHYAALNGHRGVVGRLIESGANVNSLDGEFGATPAGWAIEYLRGLGGYLAIELDDLAYAIEVGDARWVKRFLARFPALRDGVALNGKAFHELAREQGNQEVVRLFEEDGAF